TREGSRAPSPSCSVRFRLLLGDVFFKDEPSLLNRSVLVSVSTRDIAQRLRLRRMHEIRERKFALGIGVARVLKQILWLSQLMLRCMLWMIGHHKWLGVAGLRRNGLAERRGGAKQA